MNIPRKRLWFTCFLLLTASLFFPVPNSFAANDKVVLVGRISFVEGQILRYVPENKDWVATVKDAPFGMDDALYSDQAGRAEFIMPNGIWIRIGGSTQIQLIAMTDDAGEIDVASGVARFYNRSSDAVLKVTTPFGYVLADPGSSFDLYVGDQSVEVLSLGGQVDFINQANAKYDVIAGSGSIIADARQTVAGEGTVDAEWDDWNASRDSLWTKRKVKGQSTTYLPPQLYDDAHDLEENGKWERVYYEGEYHNFWTPTRVEPSWQPFSAGRWTEYYGDQCWVPAEPFGYVTHHYGNWVVVNGRWFWAPPVARVATTGPAISFGWYPGRVAWISSGANVGWVPLAPSEPYYARHHWGPRAVIVAPTAAVPVINPGHLAFVDRAVVVPQTQLYSVNTYSTHITRVEKTVIVNNYHGAPDVQRAVPNYGQFQQRHNFAPGTVAQKPHNEVIQRINQNQQLATREARVVNAQAIRQGATAAKPEQPMAKQPGLVQPPKVTNKIVAANQVAAPKNQVTFKPAELKTKAKPPTAPPADMLGPRGGATAGKPAGAGTTAPGQAVQQPAKPVQQPAKPGQQPQPGQATTAPTKPGQQPGDITQPTGRPQAPGTRPGAQEVQPGRPGAQSTQPGLSTQPTTPGRPQAPGSRQGTQEVQPARPGTQTTQPELSTQPTTPGRPQAPGRRPGAQEVQPGRPGAQSTQPGLSTQPTTPGRPQAPGSRQGTQEVQPARPGTQTTQPELSTQPTTPGRPQAPGRRPGAQEVQPGRPGAQSTQPGLSTQPTTPGRPQAPGSRQGTQEVQPGPATRPGMSTQPAAPGARQGGREIQPRQEQQPGQRGTLTPSGVTTPRNPRGADTTPAQPGRQLQDNRSLNNPAATSPVVRQSLPASQPQRPQTQSMQPQRMQQVQPQAQPQRMQQQVQPQAQPQRQQLQPQAQPQRQQVQPQAQPQRMQQQVQPQRQAGSQPAQQGQQQKKKPGEPGYQP